jgi:hypothetical protein
MGTRVRMGLMAGVRAPEEQIEKDQHSYSNRTKEIPGFFLYTQETYILSFGIMLSFHLREKFPSRHVLFTVHSRTNKTEDPV